MDDIRELKKETRRLQKALNQAESYLDIAKDEIKKLKAEIERLKQKCENTQIGYNFAQDDIKNLKKEKYKLQKALNQSEDYRVIAKAEAVKEFADMLKAEYADFDEKYETILPENINKTIDNLLAEAPNGEITKNE